MTKGYLPSSGINKFLYQNKAEIVEGYDGCLLDNGLYQAKNGMFALYEHYLNTWSSDYLMIFARTKEEIDKLWNDFVENMQNAMDEQED